MSAEIIKEFLVSINYQVNQGSEKKFTDGMATAAKGAAALALAVGAAATAVVAAVARIASQFDTLYYTSQRTGASVQNIKGLGYAFSQLGGSASQAVGTLESFTKALRNNPGLTNFVKGIGVNVNQDKAKVLTDVIDKLAQKPYYIGAQQAEMLGISEESFNLMVKNRAELARYRAEYDRTARTVGLNNDEAAKASRAFNDALLSLRATAMAVAEKIGTDLAPVITRYLNMLRDWIAANPDKIEAAIKQVIAVAEALVTTAASLVLALKPVGEMFQSIAETLTGKEGLQASMELFAIFIVTSWLTRILGAFGAVGLGWKGLLLRLGIPVGLGVLATGHGYQTPEQAAANPDSAALNKEGIDRRERVRGYIGDVFKPKEGDDRSLAERLLPKALGGKDRPEAAGGGSTAPIGGSTFSQKAPGVMKRLMEDFGLSKEEAGVVLGNLGHESAGFKAFEEGGGGPGRGWAQWTDPGRKRRFFQYAEDNKLDPKSDEANYGFLKWELQNTHKSAISALKNGATNEDKMVDFERIFEGAGIKAYGSRYKYARDAIKAYDAADQAPLQAPAPSGGPPKIDLSKAAAAAGKFDLNGITGSSPLGTSSWDNRTSNTTMHQETKIEVNGASDPAAVGSMVERNQDRVNSTMLRNATGAVR
ncbi:phage tail tip lysozyme [Methylobacterium sp. WL19]|uniref:phage tail tip lysozyme n=1 Tax=Methylobacterium sp. WL19 TaxID=2603896 RepID=UPI0011C8DB98|nr:phage tail tip lysozyme [Methylobacterium sp. WL19]TXN33898.1 hypothetical protein FV220_00150 [Methylobacterium sp. WL19]